MKVSLPPSTHMCQAQFPGLFHFHYARGDLSWACLEAQAQSRFNTQERHPILGVLGGTGAELFQYATYLGHAWRHRRGSKYSINGRLPLPGLSQAALQGRLGFLFPPKESVQAGEHACMEVQVSGRQSPRINRCENSARESITKVGKGRLLLMSLQRAVLLGSLNSMGLLREPKVADEGVQEVVS